MDYDIVYDVLSFNIKYTSPEKDKEIELWRSDWGGIQFQEGQVSLR